MSSNRLPLSTAGQVALCLLVEHLDFTVLLDKIHHLTLFILCTFNNVPRTRGHSFTTETSSTRWVQLPVIPGRSCVYYLNLPPPFKVKVIEYRLVDLIHLCTLAQPGTVEPAVSTVL